MALPEPYYDHAGITIYLGDCREILPEIPAGSVDLVLTDPPYGINAARDRNCEANGWVDYQCVGWDTERPDWPTLDLVRSFGMEQIIWGGNYFSDMLPASMRWLVWDKGQRNFDLADCELAWCSTWKASRVFNISRSAALLDGKVHATQKPLALMRWCIGLADNAQTILDPFMGSGTTLVAAKQLGRRAIGIEIEERYCAIAVRRLAQEMLPLEVEATVNRQPGLPLEGG